ncbi:uncharacterized [Tachysurus ichikawai]
MDGNDGSAEGAVPRRGEWKCSKGREGEINVTQKHRLAFARFKRRLCNLLLGELRFSCLKSSDRLFEDVLGAEKMVKILVSGGSADLLSWRSVEVRAQLNPAQPRIISSLEIFLHPSVAKVMSSLLFFLQHLPPHLTSPHRPSVLIRHRLHPSDPDTDWDRILYFFVCFTYSVLLQCIDP